MMKKYVGTKLIQAKPMAYKEYCLHKYGNFEPKGELTEINEFSEGYLVQYEGGYQSWSPKGVFEKAYAEVDLEKWEFVNVK
jgi:hypothetical protein